MRLGFFHDTPLTQQSDGTVYSTGFPYALWERYLQSFDQITVSTRMVQGDGTKLLVSSGPHVTFAPVRSYAAPADRLLRRRIIAKEIRATLASVDCAIVRLPSVIGSIAYSEARRSGTPTLVELVGCPWDAYWNHSAKGKLIAPFAYASTRRQVKTADFVLYVTEHFLQERYPTRGDSVACSDVSLEEAEPDTLASRLHRIRSRSSQQPLVLGTVAAVNVPFKGHQFVLEAMAQLRVSPSQLQYVVMGGGDQSRLRALTRKLGLIDHVRFLGALPHDQVLHTLGSEIDLYVQPSLQEGLPRSVLEAMSVGCPAIGSRTGGIPELLGNNYTFNPGNVGSLMRLIANLDDDELRTMAVHNFDIASQRYNPRILNARRRAFMDRFRGFAARVSD